MRLQGSRILPRQYVILIDFAGHFARPFLQGNRALEACPAAKNAMGFRRFPGRVQCVEQTLNRRKIRGICKGHWTKLGNCPYAGTGGAHILTPALYKAY